MPWLKEFNPIINWTKKTMVIPDSSDQPAELDNFNLQSFHSKTIKEPPTHLELLPSGFSKEEPIYPDRNFSPPETSPQLPLTGSSKGRGD